MKSNQRSTIPTLLGFSFSPITEITPSAIITPIRQVTNNLIPELNSINSQEVIYESNVNPPEVIYESNVNPPEVIYESDNDVDHFQNSDEDEAIQQAILDSIIANDHNDHNDITNIIEQQNRDYELSVLMDTEKMERERLEDEKRKEAERLEDEKRREAERLEDEKRREAEEKEQKIQALQPPKLVYPINSEAYTLRFRLPIGTTINHAFHPDEPLKSVIEQVQFDLKYCDTLTLTVLPNIEITHDPSTSIKDCGITNRSTIIVTSELK